MLTSPESVCARYPAVPDTVPRARRVLAAMAASAGASTEQVDRVRLAVSETVTNVVEHAYGERDGEVRIEGRLADDDFVIVISDEGRGMAASHNHGLGMGLSLAAHMSDGFELAKGSSGGVEVRMRFQIGGRARGRGSAICGHAARQVGNALGG